MSIRVLFLGGPGSGKGTQASILSRTLNIPHIDTGALLREEIASCSENGKIAKKQIDNGQLVPFQIVVSMIKERLAKFDCANGFILDGFPRSLEQAEGLEEILIELNIKIDAVLNIDIPEDILIARMAYRKSCPECGEKYNTKLKPPKQDNICDICNSTLTQRTDDTEETAAKRIQTYKTETEPLINYYTNQNLIVNINGEKSIDNIFNDILNLFKEEKNNDNKKIKA